MIIVSGSQRSGTSLMMNCMLEALGEGRVRGSRFPNFRRRLVRHPTDTDAIFSYKEHLYAQDINC